MRVVRQHRAQGERPRDEPDSEGHGEDGQQEAPQACPDAAQGDADHAAGVAKRKRTTLSEAFIAGYTADLLAQLDSGALLADLIPARRIVFFCVERAPEACHRSLLVAKLAGDLDRSVKNLTPG